MVSKFKTGSLLQKRRNWTFCILS